MTLPGFDVSHHQYPVDFNAAASAGHAFVVVKATEGVGYVDPSFASHRSGGHAAGLTVGLYHFARAGDPAAEADAFCAAVKQLQAGEFPVLDFEVPAANPPAWCKAWLDRVTALLGVKPLIYLNQSARDSYDWSQVVAAGYGLWLAKYDGTTTPPPGGPWPSVVMKQYTSSGSVPGIFGGCDCNAFYGDRAALAALGTPSPAGADMTPQQAAQLQAVNDAVAKLVVQVGDPTSGILKRVGDLQKAVTALATAVAAIQPTPGTNGTVIDYAALAKAVNDDAAKRLAS